MINQQNLIPNSMRSKEEVKANSAKGGRASGEARRRKKTFKQLAQLVLSLPPSEEKVKELMAAGFADDDINNKVAVIANLIKISQLENNPQAVAAFKALVNVTGEDIATAEFKLKKEEAKFKKAQEQSDEETALKKLDEVLEHITKKDGTE